MNTEKYTLTPIEVNIARQFGVEPEAAVQAKKCGLGVSNLAELIKARPALPTDIEFGAWRILDGWETPPTTHSITIDRGTLVPVRLYPVGGLHTLEPWTEQYI